MIFRFIPIAGLLAQTACGDNSMGVMGVDAMRGAVSATVHDRYGQPVLGAVVAFTDRSGEANLVLTDDAGLASAEIEEGGSVWYQGDQLTGFEDLMIGDAVMFGSPTPRCCSLPPVASMDVLATPPAPATDYRALSNCRGDAGYFSRRVSFGPWCNGKADVLVFGLSGGVSPYVVSYAFVPDVTIADGKSIVVPDSAFQAGTFSPVTFANAHDVSGGLVGVQEDGIPTLSGSIGSPRLGPLLGKGSLTYVSFSRVFGGGIQSVAANIPDQPTTTIDVDQFFAPWVTQWLSDEGSMWAADDESGALGATLMEVEHSWFTGSSTAQIRTFQKPVPVPSADVPLVVPALDLPPVFAPYVPPPNETTRVKFVRTATRADALQVVDYYSGTPNAFGSDGVGSNLPVPFVTLSQFGPSIF